MVQWESETGNPTVRVQWEIGTGNLMVSGATESETGNLKGSGAMRKWYRESERKWHNCKVLLGFGRESGTGNLT